MIVSEKKKNLYIVSISFDELSYNPQHMLSKTEWSDGQAPDSRLTDGGRRK